MSGSCARLRVARPCGGTSCASGREKVEAKCFGAPSKHAAAGRQNLGRRRFIAMAASRSFATAAEELAARAAAAGAI